MSGTRLNNSRGLRNSFKKYACMVGLCIVSANTIASPFDDFLATVGVHEWKAIPNSNMDAVAPDPLPPGNAQPGGVMTKWSGGTYDFGRDRLLVWGGGHKGYAGNEIYAFDVNNMKWVRLTDPTPNSQLIDTSSAYADGNPSARHTYDGLAYIPPPYDMLYGRGGSWWSTTGNNGNNDTWLFSFTADSWSQGATYPSDQTLNELTDYDFVSGQVYSHGKRKLSAYNPANDSWTVVTTDDSGQKLGGNGVIDPVRRLFVRIGRDSNNVPTGRYARVWDIHNTPPVRQDLNSTGDNEIEDANAPGVVYDPVSDKIVAWDGFDTSGSVYVLDMDTRVWTKISPSGSVRPAVHTSKEYNGTFGRFQYVKSKNAFIAVSYTDENVYVYKLNDSAPMAKPAKPAKPTVVLK